MRLIDACIILFVKSSVSDTTFEINFDKFEMNFKSRHKSLVAQICLHTKYLPAIHFPTATADADQFADGKFTADKFNV